MKDHQGGCLCGALRFATRGAPEWVTICHCHFCQRTTGAAYAVLPIFARSALTVSGTRPVVHTATSQGSGKQIHIRFCKECGTKVSVGFERAPDFVGIYAGAFDAPNWFEISARTTRHIFVASARRGTVIPAGIPTYREHVRDADGAPVPPHVFDLPHTIEA